MEEVWVGVRVMSSRLLSTLSLSVSRLVEIPGSAETISVKRRGWSSRLAMISMVHGRPSSCAARLSPSLSMTFSALTVVAR